MSNDYFGGYLEAIDDVIIIVKHIVHVVTTGKERDTILNECATALTDLSIKRNIAKSKMKEGK